jgi:hypothetical protein
VLAGAGAFLLSMPRSGLVENPAFDAAELLERDRKALVGTRVQDSSDIVDEHGLPTGLRYVEDVKGVYRSQDEAQAAVDRLNADGDDSHVVAWIRDESTREGWYSTNLPFTEGTDDEYEFVAASLSETSVEPTNTTSDVTFVPDGAGGRWSH